MFLAIKNQTVEPVSLHLSFAKSKKGKSGEGW
jgi:hypothetical protein